MKIVQIQKQSLIEYPGKISAVIFLAGCPLRCPWCYVPRLVLPERIKELKPIPEKEIFSFLKERKGFLDAASITGGEPTLNPELPEFMKKHRCHDVVCIEYNKLTLEQEFEAWFKYVMGW